MKSSTKKSPPKKQMKPFISSGKENVSPRVKETKESPNKKKESLEEQAEKVSSLIGNKILESQARTEQALNDIAYYQNKLQTKRASFKTKLKTKKDEQKIKYQNILKDIQSKISVQLSENELLTSKIDNLTKEIEELSKPKEIPDLEPISIDYSKKTEKILKEREIEIRKKSELEFNPLFEKLKMKHLRTIESLKEEHELKIQQINEKADNEISNFAPRAFISNEELRMRQYYDNIFQKEKLDFEKQKSIILERISIIEKEKERTVQQITDEVDEQIFNEEKIFKEKIQIIRNSVIEPDIPDFSKEYEITPEQEKEFRKTAEQKLKDNFQKLLQESVSDVAQRREMMEKEIIDYEKTKSSSLAEKYEKDINDTINLIQSQKEEISFLKSEINSLKAEWNDMNQSRRDNEETSERLISEVSKLNEEYSQIQKEIEIVKKSEDEKPDEEMIILQDEIDKLSNEVQIAKKFHIHLVKKIKAKHFDSLTTIQQRVTNLTAMKDQTIDSLSNELRNIKKKTKILSESIQSKLTKYQQ